MSKSYEILSALANRLAKGETLTFSKDYGLGSGTLTFADGAHTHFGADVEDEDRKAVNDFVDGLHDLLVKGHGLTTSPADGCTCRSEPMENGGLRLIQCPACGRGASC